MLNFEVSYVAEFLASAYNVEEKSRKRRLVSRRSLADGKAVQ